MTDSIALHHSTDEIVEVRVAVNNRVITSRVNHSHLARIRQTLAAIAKIRSDAVRLGLFELALCPTSISRTFLRDAAIAPVPARALAAQRRGRAGFGAPAWSGVRPEPA